MSTIRNPINRDTTIDLTDTLDTLDVTYGQYADSGLFTEQGINNNAFIYKVKDVGKTKMTKLTSKTERDAMALDKGREKLITMAGITIKETGGVHVEDLIGLSTDVITEESPTFQQELVKELGRLANTGAANFEYLITTASQGKVRDPKDGTVVIDQYANTGTTQTTLTIDANPSKSIFASMNALRNTLAELNGYYGNFGTIEVVLDEKGFDAIVNHPDFFTLYQLAFTGMGNAALRQPIANGMNMDRQVRNRYGYRREFAWENLLFVTYPQKFYRWDGTVVDITEEYKGWTIVHGVTDLYQVKYCPAPYLSTFKALGQRWFARSTGIVDDTHADVTLESHLIPFMQRPEMALDITVTVS